MVLTGFCLLLCPSKSLLRDVRFGASTHGKTAIRQRSRQNMQFYLSWARGFRVKGLGFGFWARFRVLGPRPTGDEMMTVVWSLGMEPLGAR